MENQLKFELVRIIRERCPECSIFSQKYLRKGFFLCYNNPTHTIYRSTLVNPFSTKNSTEVVSIIQEWVSTTPSLILDDLLVRVNPSCPTGIPSLDDKECKDGLESDPETSTRIGQVLSACALRELEETICTL